MPTYRYNVISDSGERLSGVLEASDEFDAARKIKTSVGGFIQTISRVGFNIDIELTKPRLHEKSLSMCCSQFSILLKAGLPLARTVEVVAEQSVDKVLRKILQEVLKDVREGYGLANSLEKHGDVLPLVFTETVRAGEASGTLESSFAKMERYFSKASKLKKKVKSAMTYPIFLIVVAIVVVAIVVQMVLPAFLPMFAGRELPFPTQVLLSIYGFFASYWYIPLAAVVLTAVLFINYRKSELGKLNLARTVLKLPIIGKVGTMNAAAQFSKTMAALLSSGLPMVHALKITGKVLSNLAVGRSIQEATKGVTEGKRLGEAMRENQFLPPLLIEMTAVGEESGALEETLFTIGAFYDEEADAATTSALSKLEPIITIVMGMVVAFIMVSLYMPMFDMVGGIT